MVEMAEVGPRRSALEDRSPYDSLIIGLDVGSMTVKAVVMDPRTDEILWKDYERHNTRQPEKVFEFLQRIEDAFPLPRDKFRIFITGSGGKMLEGVAIKPTQVTELATHDHEAHGNDVGAIEKQVLQGPQVEGSLD